MEELINQKTKSPLEKMAPIILLIGAIILVYFIVSKIKTNPIDNNIQTTNNPNVQVEVDTNFLMLEAFTKLKYIPDSSIFDEVTGDVPKGKEDPFSSVK